MKIGAIVLVTAILTLATQSAASTFLRPQGRFSTLFNDLKWEPSYNCYKPMRPFNNDKFAWNLYKQQATNYLDCMKQAADNDAKYAVEKVYEGYQQAADDFLAEIKRGY